MNNKLITVVLMCLVVTSGFLGFAVFESEIVRAANTLYVGGGGGSNYTSIQEAIDAAIPGDSIFVYDDSSPYNENVIIDRSVNLIGENRDTTTIYGGSSGARVLIESDWVSLSGFTVTGMGPFDSSNRGIYIDYSSHIDIDDVNISGNSYGIYGRGSNPTDSDIRITNSIFYDNTDSGIRLQSSGNCLISNNTILDNDVGLRVYSLINSSFSNNTIIGNGWTGILLDGADDNILTDNHISDHDGPGIYLTYSNNNIFLDTMVTHNGLWWDPAVYISRSNNNQFVNLTVSDTIGPGIYLRESSNNLFSKSIIENSGDYGVYLYDFSNDNTISDCYIANNSEEGIYLNFWCSGNLFINNTISNNNYGVYIIDNSQGVIYNSSISSSIQSDIFVQSNSELDSVNTSFDKSSIDVSGESVLRVKWYLHIEVNNNSLPVDAAEVIIRDASGEVVGTLLTNVNGKVQWIEVVEFVQEDTQRTYNTPHNVTAFEINSYGAALPEPNMDMSRQILINLNLTKPRTDKIIIEAVPGQGWLEQIQALLYSQFVLYASEYNDTYGFIKPAEVDWNSDNSSIASVDPGPATQTLLSANTIGNCNITTTNSTLGLSNQTTIEVFALVHNVDKDLYYVTIQSAIDDADPGNTLLASSWTYEENVIINKPVNLIGEDRNTTVIYGGSSGARVLIESDWVSLSGFTVTGMGPFDSSNRGIYIDYSSHIDIDDVNISGNSYGIYGRGSNPTDSDIRITNSIFYDNTDSGIRLQSSGNCLISNNTILDNDVGLRVYSLINSSFSNNTISGNGWTGILLDGADDNILTDNHISDHDGPGIYLTYSNNNIFLDTMVTHNGLWWDPAVYISRSNNNQFVNLTVSDTIGPGIYLRESSNNLFSKSIIENSGDYGVYLYDFSNDNTISDCYIANNSEEGIYLNYWSRNNTFSMNTVFANDYGVYLTDYSQAVIYNSTISNSNQEDIFVQTDSELDTVNTTFDKSSIEVSDNSILRVKWYLHVEVRNILSLPVDGAEVIIRNTGGEVMGTGLTDTNGRIQWMEVMEFIQEDSQRTYHTPHNITAFKDMDYGAAVPETNMSMSQNIIITLNLTKPGTDRIIIEKTTGQGWPDLVSVLLYSQQILYASEYNDTYGYIKPAEVTWDSDNSLVASVDPGPATQTTLSANDLGNCNITVTNATLGLSNQTAIEVFALVHNVDKDIWYVTIQSAIDDANPGNTLLASSWTYEENVIINKPVNLIGEDRNTTVIYGGSTDSRVVIESDWVSLSGFTVTGMGPFDSSNRGIYIDYSSHIDIDDVNISGNSYGIYGRGSNPTDSDIRITNSIFYDNTDSGIRLQSSGNCLISNNTILDNDVGLRVYSLINSSFSNNTIIGNGWTGILLDGADDNILTDNHISDHDGPGIYLTYSNNNIFLDTMVTHNGLWWDPAVYISRSNNNQFVNLTVSDTIGPGIYLRESSNNLFSKSIIENSGDYGAYLYDFSNDNTISDCYIANNSEEGIYLNYWCSGNLFINNTISNNNYGIYITDNSDFNLIYSNNIINNTNQAYDECINTWNSSYPIGGNYWSNYSPTSPDLYDGVVTPQTAGSPDGICDVQYDIDADSTDYYPLKGPWVPSQDIPTAPLNLVAIPGVYHINISWSSPASDGGSPILHYSIYRGITPGGEIFLAQVNFDVTSYTDNSVSSGFTYYYRVSASNAIGESPLSNEDSAMPLSEPMEPTGLTGTSGDSYVNLTWSAPAQDGGSPIITYSIYRNGSFYDTVQGNQQWYNDTGVLNDVTYTYTVSATNSIGEGALSSSWATTKTVPTTPQSLQPDEGDSYVFLTWSAPSDDGGLNIIGYNIYREGVLMDTVSGNQLYWNDTSVVNGITYTYRISANNSLGESLLSSEVEGTPMAKPSAPLNLQVEEGDGYVYLTWSVPLDDGGSAVVEYHIYRNGALYDTVSAGQMWFNDTNTVNGVTYTYSISAKNDAGEGPESSGQDATPLGKPSAPQNLNMSAEDGYVNITWDAPSTNGGSTITKYIIYRGTSSGGESFLVEVGDVYYYNDTGAINGETYFYKVSAINSIGEGAMSSEVSATPEAPVPPLNQLPVASILTPSSGAILSGTFLFSGTAMDNDSAVQRVEIRIDDGAWIQVNGTTSWDYEWDTTTVANGEYSIRIRVYDGTDYSQEIVRSVIINNPAEEEPTEEDMTWLWLLIILIVIITLILLLLLVKRKKPEKKEIEEEVPKPIPPPPSEEGAEEKTEGAGEGGEDKEKAEVPKQIPPPPPPPPPPRGSNRG